MARRDPLQDALPLMDTHGTEAPGVLVTIDGTHHRTEQTSIFDLTD